jgi:hypothetical protein
MVLKWILKKYGVRVCFGFIYLRIHLGSVFLYEPLGYMKDSEFFDWVGDC